MENRAIASLRHVDSSPTSCIVQNDGKLYITQRSLAIVAGLLYYVDEVIIYGFYVKKLG